MVRTPAAPASGATSKPTEFARVPFPLAAGSRLAFARPPRGSALARALPAARRQVDLASRLHLRPADLRRDRDRGAARGRRRAAHRRGLRGARRGDRASRARPLADPRSRASARCSPPRETLDFGNAGTGSRLMMGVVGGHGITATFDGDASLRKRPMGRILDPLRLMGAEVLVAGGGRALPDRAQGRPRPRADPLPDAGRLGADQVGRAARRPQRARRDHGRSRPRPRATTPRRCSPISAPRSRSRREGEGRRIDLVGRPELEAAAGRRPGRPVLGGLPDRRRADRPGLRHRRRGRDDEPAAHRAADDAHRDGRRHRGPRPAGRGRRGGRGLAGARERARAASTFRRRARPR